MVERQIDILNQLGLHARAAAKVVHAASHHACEVRLEFKGEEVDAKSILGLLLLAAPFGEKVTVRCDGEDENQAMESLSSLFADRFGEGS